MAGQLNNLHEDGPIVVLIDDVELSSACAKRVGALSPRIELVRHTSPAAVSTAHVIYTAAATFDPAEVPGLKWVQTESVSIAHLLHTPLARSGVPVANVRGAFSPNVAELAIGLLLTLTRKLHACYRLQAASRWPDDDQWKKLLGQQSCYGKTLGILGYGSIGRHVAQIAAAMGMKVLACNRYGKKTKDEGYCHPDAGDPQGILPEQWYGIDQLKQMLPRCDAVVLCLPLTGETRRWITKRQLHWLPNHACLVDVGRGGVLDLDALSDCLAARQLAGAALDVFEVEPLPNRNLLWALPNVVISPHIGSGPARDELAVDVLVDNLCRFLQGRPLVNVVDFNRQY